MQQNIINSCLEPLCPKKMAFKCNTNPFHWLRNLNPCVHVTLTSVDWPPHPPPPPRYSPHLHPRTSGHRWWHQTMSVTAQTHCKTSTSSDASASSFSFFHCGVNIMLYLTINCQISIGIIKLSRAKLFLYISIRVIHSLLNTGTCNVIYPVMYLVLKINLYL